jgi:hypothetical protein
MTSSGRPIALPPYRSAEQYPGPCYVLCPDAWELGWREVLRVLPPRLPPVKRPRIVLYAPLVRAGGSRSNEPLWHAKARIMRSQGVTVRGIMRDLGLVNYAAVYKVVTGPSKG